MPNRMARRAMETEETPAARPRAVVVGSSGGIGRALADALQGSGYEVDRLSRSEPAGISIDITDETSIAAAASALSGKAPYHLIIVATGILQTGAVRPEKSFRELQSDTLLTYFAVNSVGPALVAKHFVPLLPATGRSVFAVLSARVGSIGDNRLGGWYGYRASKAALNMLVKTLSIEMSRLRRDAICIALHPGTVDTDLSRPFQKNVPADRLFASKHAAEHLLQVIRGLTPAQSGGCFGWDGEPILP
jgi:NAD(P)-dependent dehydrogenase (short-subunit alcohol dehydrogenase family)